MSYAEMKAVQQHAFGGPEVLSYEGCAHAGPAGSVKYWYRCTRWRNPPDSYLRDGYQQLPPGWRRGPLSMILGTDLSGVVARGRMTSGRWRSATKCMLWRVSRRGGRGSRAYAEYISVPVSDLARKP